LMEDTAKQGIRCAVSLVLFRPFHRVGSL
jgi:hypothetical protein